MQIVSMVHLSTLVGAPFCVSADRRTIKTQNVWSNQTTSGNASSSCGIVPTKFREPATTAIKNAVTTAEVGEKERSTAKAIAADRYRTPEPP